jgi:hypothetical protein
METGRNVRKSSEVDSGSTRAVLPLVMMRGANIGNRFIRVDGGSRFLRNVGNQLPGHKTSQPGNIPQMPTTADVNYNGHTLRPTTAEERFHKSYNAKAIP